MATSLLLRRSAFQLASTQSYHGVYAARRYLTSTSIVLKKARRSNKRGPPDATPKQCSGSSQTQYCSGESQKVDWKSHEKTCGKTQPSTATSTSGASTTEASSSEASSTESKPGSSRPTHDMPFTRLDQGIWLHDRPEMETYKLLIDAYRLRVEDAYVFRGERMKGSLYATRSSGIQGFRKFLEKAATVPGLLPPWWNDEKKRACENLGMEESQWSSLSYCVEKSDIIDHYKDRLFPMKLRMLGEAIYGEHPSGPGGAEMRKLMMGMEQGGSGANGARGLVHHIDWSTVMRSLGIDMRGLGIVMRMFGFK